jgi:coenzyme PQQ precursor peptide PqqA
MVASQHAGPQPRQRIMKIMRRDCMPARLRPGRSGDEHDAWELTFPRDHRRWPANLTKETPMQWTTPTATDFRFGFEITMYVSAR